MIIGSLKDSKWVQYDNAMIIGCMSEPQHFSWSFRGWLNPAAGHSVILWRAALFRTNLCARPRFNKPSTWPSCVNSKSQGMCTEQNHNSRGMLQYVAISCACSCFVFTYCSYFVVYFGPMYPTSTTDRSFADQTPVGSSTLSVPVQTVGSMSGKQRSD